MVEVARRDHPDLRFTVGSLTALDVADGALAGVVAWYSIIHTPDDGLPALFAELARVLATGGHLLLAFQAGNAVRHVTHAYGHDFDRRSPTAGRPRSSSPPPPAPASPSKPAWTEPRNHRKTYPRPTCCYAEPDAARQNAGDRPRGRAGQRVADGESAAAMTARRAATWPSKAVRPVLVRRARTRRRRSDTGRSMAT